eukprot:TRINITY_DN7303_c0_g2_i1.p1 TRINITY_DN7303_c0_g2~~TRINITY_DN7303_c0_g2_i1.p1  ORF type:complete len:166 (+),score=45.69 TRINITY_DN7303_c0_g2_i1:125-622(+)
MSSEEEVIDTNGEAVVNEETAWGSQPKRKRMHEPGSQKAQKEARKENHKIVEQKRRMKINEKINELRELLELPNGTENKAVVLQFAAENIRSMKDMIQKLNDQSAQQQQEYIHLLHENEKLKSLIEPDALEQSKLSKSPRGKNNLNTLATLSSDYSGYSSKELDE